MNAFEWLLWRWDLWRLRKPCRANSHDLTGPHMTATPGLWVYTCTRCPHRFAAGRVVGPAFNGPAETR